MQPLRLLSCERAPLVTFHVGNSGADALHCLLAAIRAHDAEGGRRIAGTAQINGLAELLHFLRGVLLQDAESPQLLGALRHQNLCIFDLAGKRGAGLRVRFEVVLIAGQQKAALAGFGVLHR